MFRIYIRFLIRIFKAVAIMGHFYYVYQKRIDTYQVKTLVNLSC